MKPATILQFLAAAFFAVLQLAATQAQAQDGCTSSNLTRSGYACEDSINHNGSNSIEIFRGDTSARLNRESQVSAPIQEGCPSHCEFGSQRIGKAGYGCGTQCDQGTRCGCAHGCKSRQLIGRRCCGGCRSSCLARCHACRVGLRRHHGRISCCLRKIGYFHHGHIPPGDMIGHLPYETERVYYYLRPYQDRHTPDWFGRISDYDYPEYLKEFDNVHDQYERKIRSAVVKARSLEFIGIPDLEKAIYHAPISSTSKDGKLITPAIPALPRPQDDDLNEIVPLFAPMRAVPAEPQFDTESLPSR